MAVLICLLFSGGLFWARSRDPFQRIWFKVKVGGYTKMRCVAVLPKATEHPLPVVIYSHAAGGSSLMSGDDIRQMAEMGLAVVGMDYSQTNEMIFDEQFSTLLAWLQHQHWADTNRIAWVGLSLGGQRQFNYALRNPSLRPKVLVCVFGAWFAEPNGLVRPNTGERALPNVSSGMKTAESSVLEKVLLIQATNDQALPMLDAERVLSCFGSNGVPLEVKIVSGQGDESELNHLLIFRVIGEYCLEHLSGPDALRRYRSVLGWQEGIPSIWLFWIPAELWAALWISSKQRHRIQHKVSGAGPSVLRWFAVFLALAALAETALHLIPPQLTVSKSTLGFARKHLVRAKEIRDFDSLAANPKWYGKELKTLLEHMELANYNRDLIDWRLDDVIYRDFVLCAEIDPQRDGDLKWRRLLWNSFYPRIRKQQTPEAAAGIVVQHLRERVTIFTGSGAAETIGQAWRKQITDERGFESLYVAAMRSVGIPSHLNREHKADLWNGAKWQLAPRPLVGECWR